MALPSQNGKIFGDFGHILSPSGALKTWVDVATVKTDVARQIRCLKSSEKKISGYNSKVQSPSDGQHKHIQGVDHGFRWFTRISQISYFILKT